MSEHYSEEREAEEDRRRALVPITSVKLSGAERVKELEALLSNARASLNIQVGTTVSNEGGGVRLVQEEESIRLSVPGAKALFNWLKNNGYA